MLHPHRLLLSGTRLEKKNQSHIYTLIVAVSWPLNQAQTVIICCGDQATHWLLRWSFKMRLVNLSHWNLLTGELGNWKSACYWGLALKTSSEDWSILCLADKLSSMGARDHYFSVREENISGVQPYSYLIMKSFTIFCSHYTETLTVWGLELYCLIPSFPSCKLVVVYFPSWLSSRCRLGVWYKLCWSKWEPFHGL